MSSGVEQLQRRVEERIVRLVRLIAADPDSFGVLSTGEQIAVALVLDRKDLLERVGCRTMLEAFNRLGDDWLIAAYRVQREGWDA